MDTDIEFYDSIVRYNEIDPLTLLFLMLLGVCFISEIIKRVHSRQSRPYYSSQEIAH